MSRRTIFAAASVLATLAAGVALFLLQTPGVEGASPAVKAALEDCEGPLGSAGSDCYLGHVERRVQEAGTAEALEMVAALARRMPRINESGHAFVHAVGMAAYRVEGSVHEAFASCTDLFQSGCHHGALQAHFRSLDSVIPADIRGVCRPYREEGRRLMEFQCHHGLGHGLTMYHGHHLPRALEDCDALERKEDRHGCYGGAFMENAVVATRPHHPISGGGTEHSHGPSAALEWKPMDPDDPHHPCSAVDERYWTACYEMQTSIMFRVNDGRLGAVADDCADAPEGWREACFRGLGRSISIRSFRDLDRAAQLCRVGPEHLRPHCHQGLAHTLMILGTRPFPDVGFDLCRRVLPGQRPERLRCYYGVGGALQSRLTEADRRRACGRAPRAADRRACRIGAGLEQLNIEGLLEAAPPA